MKSLFRGLLFASLSFVSSSCAQTGEGVALTAAPLTDDQCMYFAQSGKVTVCHATGSATNPFKLIRVATAACVNAHTDHAGDFIAPDGDCGPGACLAEDAPCDATLPCCDELACSDGWCTAPTPTCDSESFDAVGCSQGGELGHSVSVFSGAATLTKPVGSTLVTFVPFDENCEGNFGACSTYALDTTHPIMTGYDGSNTLIFDFAQLTSSFSAGKVYGNGSDLQGITFKFFRAGALVATEVIDRTGMDCVNGASGSWAPGGGFDRVVVNGALFGLTELEACRN